MRRTALGLFCLAAAACDRPAAPGRAKLYERLHRACVEVLVDDQLAGSGWFADARGLVLTSAHVVTGPVDHPAGRAAELTERAARKRVEVLSPVAGRIRAVVVGFDRGHDLALLRVPARDGGYPALPIATGPPRVGERLFVHGEMQGEHGVLLTGTVAVPRATYGYFDDQGCYVRILHLHAMSGPGMSGGAWVNARGEVVAQQTGSLLYRKSRTGIAHAPPADGIREFLRAGRTSRTATLGIKVIEAWGLDSGELERLPAGIEGLAVRTVHAGRPAAAVGIEPGHVIVELDGKPVRYRDQFLDAVRAKRPGDSVRLGILKPAASPNETYSATLRLEALEGDE